MPADAPWLLVGLGNPGPGYARHRHNVGFMVTDMWIERHADPGAAWRSKWSARVGGARVGSARVVVLQPQTYMNRSGHAMAQAAAFHRVPVQQIVVVHDELDFPFGRVAVKRGGGHGGHNGLRDLMAHLPSAEFSRIRFGIGRPAHGEVADWVLSNFSGEDAAFLPERIEQAVNAADAVIDRGVAAAMNEFNRVT